MKRKLDTDYLSWYYETKQNLESAHKRQRIFAHPTSKSKLLRCDMNQYIENHNSNIDTQINSEMNKLMRILKDVIIDNDMTQLQQLISHGILHEMNECATTTDDTTDSLSNSDIITQIIGCILQYNREEALLIVSPFIECQYFDISKFDKPILSDPYKIVLFLHSNAYISLSACHCKLFHKAVEYGHYETVKYCLDHAVAVDSCQNRAIRDAARYGHLEIVQLLATRGGNIHQYKDECLRKAARHGHLKVLQYLIAAGGDIAARNSEALTRSVQNGHRECAQLLIQSGLNKGENLSITSTAIKHKRYECLSLLICNGYCLYDEKLRLLALSALYGAHSTTDYVLNAFDDPFAAEKEKEKDELMIYESESSVSPPLSPQYTMHSPPRVDAADLLFNDNHNMQRLLDAISEGLALRETLFVSVLSQFIYVEIAYCICSLEKLALTEEDQAAAAAKIKRQII
eukprot:454795_1